MNEQDLVNLINLELPDNKTRRIAAESVRNVFQGTKNYVKENFATKEQMAQYAASAIVGVYDSTKVPQDYALFDDNATNRFIVKETAGFTTSADWGSITITTQQLEDNEVHLYYGASDGWKLLLMAKPADGEPGQDGKTILNGTGTPSSGLGSDGDFYIDTAAQKIYGPKTAGAWGAGIDLKGPAGNMSVHEWDGSSAFAGLTYPTIVSKEGKLYRVVEGETTLAADDPSTSNKYEPIGGGSTTGTVVEYITASFSNNGYYTEQGVWDTSVPVVSRATDKIRVYPGERITFTGATTQANPVVPALIFFDKDDSSVKGIVYYPVIGGSLQTVEHIVEEECDVVGQFRVTSWEMANLVANSILTVYKLDAVATAKDIYDTQQQGALVTEWKNNNTYTFGVLKQHGGTTYRVINREGTNEEPSDNSADWERFVKDDTITDTKTIIANDYEIADGDYRKLLLVESSGAVLTVNPSVENRLREVKGISYSPDITEIKAADGVTMYVEDGYQPIVKSGGEFKLFYIDFNVVKLTGELYRIDEEFAISEPEISTPAPYQSLLMGALTTNGVDVKAVASGAGEGYVTVYADNARTEVVTYSTIGKDVGFDTHYFRIRGLKPNTEYFYTLDSFEGRFKTLPLNSTFKIALGSCGHGQPDSGPDEAWNSNHEVYGHLAANHGDAHFLLHMGDFHYADLNAPGDVEAYFQKFEDTIKLSNQQAVYEKLPIVYMQDDHDFCGNDSGGNSTGKVAHLTAKAIRFPQYPLAFPTTYMNHGHTFRVGKVQFIIIDERANRVLASQIAGKRQVGWIIDILSGSDADLFVIQTGNNWIGTSPEGWDKSAGERERIMAAIYDLHLEDNVIFVAGDAHMLAYDDGTNNKYSNPDPVNRNGCWVFQCASFDSGPSVKGGPYSGGTFAGRGQYATMEFVDNVDTIDINFQGHRYIGTTYTKLIDVNLSVPKRNAPKRVIAPRITAVGDASRDEHVAKLLQFASAIPSEKAITALDFLISKLKSEGIWQKLDAFFNFAYNDADTNLVTSFGFYNLIPNAVPRLLPQDATLTGTGNEGGLIINAGVLNYAVNIENYTNMTWDKGTLGAITLPTVDIDGARSDGSFIVSSGNSTYALSYNVGIYSGNVAAGSLTPLGAHFVLKTGMRAVVRTDATHINFYIGGDYTERTHTTPVTASLGTSLRLGRQGFPMTNPLSCAWWGAPLTYDELEIIRTAYNRYLSMIGLNYVL